MSNDSSKKPKKLTSSYYIIEKGKIKRTRPVCERCGAGYFMADHGDRFSCGHCGLTRYKHVDDPNK
jgi:small subunit ribosomal protein S27Ae